MPERVPDCKEPFSRVLFQGLRHGLGEFLPEKRLLDEPAQAGFQQGRDLLRGAVPGREEAAEAGMDAAQGREELVAALARQGHLVQLEVGVASFRQDLALSDPAAPDRYLLTAKTCFFSLELPRYTAKSVVRERLLLSIHPSPTMDMDVVLHGAEGFID